VAWAARRRESAWVGSAAGRQFRGAVASDQ